MSIFKRLQAWWGKNDLETADEETRTTPAERDVAEEDFEARKDDVEVRRDRLGGAADYERDSEPPS
jgi:hypothetical protein